MQHSLTVIPVNTNLPLTTVHSVLLVLTLLVSIQYNCYLCRI